MAQTINMPTVNIGMSGKACTSIPGISRTVCKVGMKHGRAEKKHKASYAGLTTCDMKTCRLKCI